MNHIRLTLIAIPALVAAGLLSACEPAEINKTLAVLAGSSYEPTADDLSRLSEYVAEHPEVRAKLVGDYTEGSAVVSALISSAQLESSSEPVSSEVVVAVVEPPAPVSHVVCPEPFEWRGQMVQNPCWLEWD